MVIALVLALGTTGCTSSGGDDDDDDECTVTPTAWSADGFDTNAAGGLAVRELIRVLQSDVMNAAEQATWSEPTTPPDAQTVLDAYEAGSPSIADLTPPELDTLIRQTIADWAASMAQDPATYDFIDADGLAWVATGEGGVHERPPEGETRRFRAYSASGVEHRQLIDKGLFVGTLYNYALGLTEGTITPATIQDIAAAWGANPTLDATVAEGEAANDDSANYAAQMGLYDETATALIAAQAYAGDALCAAERDEALVQVFALWEEAMFARGTYYANQPVREVLDPTVPESVLGPLHGASEGYGLMAGLLGMAEPASGPLAGSARIITDDDIEQAFTALGVDLADLSAGTTGQWLVESPSTYSDGVNGDFKEIVQRLYGWDEAQFTEYANTPVATE
jgi:hypothetical protein